MRSTAAALPVAAAPCAALCRSPGPAITLPRLAGLQKSAASRRARPQRSTRDASVRATAAPAAEKPSTVAGGWERQLPLGQGAFMTVQVSTNERGEQSVAVSTNHPGRLLLHWGVEGGKGYKGGWRLPAERCRPDGTVMYKQRALQTPFRVLNGNGVQSVELRLSGDEASDFLNFVVKDEATGQWFDLNGTNFQVGLRGQDDPMAVPLASTNGNGNGNGAAVAARELPPLLPMDRVPQLPQELCGIWAYIKWEVSGCPNRSKEEADREYEQGIQEMVMLLRRGRPLDELWRVARGEIKYADFIQQHGYLLAPEGARQAVAAPPQKQQKERKREEKREERREEKREEPGVYVPEDLIGVQAYLLWEQAGKPDGADFGEQARKILEGRLRKGESLQDVERSLREPQPQQAKQQAKQAAPVQQQPAPAVVGQSMGMRSRNPLDLINRSAVPLLSEKKRYLRTPLTPLLEATQGDASVNWHRLYKLGDKVELLVAVSLADPNNPDSEVTVNMTTSMVNPAVLHWGVKKAGRGSDWLQPPEHLLPPSTTIPSGGIAAETPFQSCTDEDCMLDWSQVDFEPEDFGGSRHPLQRIRLQIPSGHHLAALTFVIRSDDGTAWYRDAGSNFTVPVPGSRTKKDRDTALGFDDELSRIIVDCEVNTGAWTLMHRFNKATDLLGDVMGGRFKDTEGSLARIYVWLRYSAIRQLTWQRNYTETSGPVRKRHLSRVRQTGPERNLSSGTAGPFLLLAQTSRKPSSAAASASGSSQAPFPRCSSSWMRASHLVLTVVLVTAAALVHPAAAARRLAQAVATDTAPAAAPAAAPVPGATKEEEAALLLAFKDSLDNGDEILSNWRPGSDPCAWEGISCDADGSVNGLVVLDKGLTGTIPPNGWVLPRGIKDLSLGNAQAQRRNKIRGPIPPTWELPPALEILVLNYLPLGGTLSPEWKLPPKLAFWLMEGANVTGPLPNGWTMPPLQSVNLNFNLFEGTIPREFTELDSLVFLNLEYNRMSGPIPTSFRFNNTYDAYGVSLSGNNFSGPVPAWPDEPASLLAIYPGNELLCGEVPASPALLQYGADGSSSNTVTSLPPCPGQSSGGLSTGALVGIAVGSVVAGAIVLAGAALLVRSRRRQNAARPDVVSLSGGKLSSLLPPSNDSLVKFDPYNPFSGGPGMGSSSSGSSRVVLSSAAARMAGSNGSSGSTPAVAAELKEQLELLERDAPPWLISPTRLKLDVVDGHLVLLGRGSFGRVYRGWLQPPGNTAEAAGGGEAAGAAAGGEGAAAGEGPAAAGCEEAAAAGTPVAVKVMEAVDIRAFLKEVGLLHRLNGGPHTVEMLGAAVVEQQHLVMVMELMEGGDLRSALSSDAGSKLFRWGQDGRQVALDIAEGMAWLHANNITHRDLKSRNVLLSKEGRAKVADVGGAVLHTATYLSAGSSAFGGTLAWAAPELLLGMPCSNKVDVYSLGVCLVEICTAEVPQRGAIGPPPPNEHCPAGLAQLIADCLQQDPQARPTSQEVLERLRAL